ncbi:MAG TPA: ABC transporter substrate-binding protein [Xanthobacteraceae bacterium]|nr:ABC transporter substrate-binding protein [Xanthobacteraceae bacterium]
MVRKIAFAVLMLTAAAVRPAAAEKVVIGLPGVPPIFATTLFYVADKEGYYKKYGVEAENRQFDSGTAAARAVASGDIDMSLSPTGLVVNQVANAAVPVVAILGYPNPDWAIGTTGTKATCQDMAGQQVGVDTPGGARSIALKEMLLGCGSAIEKVQQVGLGSNTAPAMIAGQISYGVLHLDDVPEIESSGKKVTIVTTLAKSNPTSHYLVVIARKDRLAQKRDAIVRAEAALIAASHFMKDPKNADKVADIAAQITGRDKKIAKGALERFLEIGFWPVDDDGMAQNKIDAVVATQKKIGNIKEGKTPPTYQQLVDSSVWKDADAMYKKQH